MLIPPPVLLPEFVVPEPMIAISTPMPLPTRLLRPELAFPLPIRTKPVATLRLPVIRLTPDPVFALPMTAV